MTESEASGAGKPPSSYMIFVVVFLFFLTGLLGFLICHLLKKKGYRCRTGDLEDEEDKLGEDEDDENDENQDTVEQILKCIMENEANMEAFNEMLGNHNVCVRHDPRLRKESIGGVPPHHHTVHSGTDHNSCLLCTQVRAKKGRRQSRTPRFKKPGEQTVFSVGRFHVTHSAKKPQGGSNRLAASGDQLDQSQDSDERKEDGYNLKNMFKEVQPPSDGTNGVAANVGKRKKSLTIFGLRRGSDPLGLRVKDRAWRETGGIRFAAQRPPVVLEEPVQAEKVEACPESGTKPGAKRNTEPASVQFEGKTSILKRSPKSNSGPQEGSKLELSSDLQEKMSTGASAPTSLPISHAKSETVDNKVLKMEDPGPLQTSTPIDTPPAPVLGFTSVLSTGQSHLNKDFMAVRALSDPCSSPDPEPAISGGLALISLGSSPATSFLNKTFSSVSSLKTPTSSLTESPSPKSSLRKTTTEVTNTILSSPLEPSSSPTAASPYPILMSERFSVRSATQGNTVPSSLSIKEHKLEEQNIEKKRPGILKTSKLSPVATGEPISSSEQMLKDRLSSLPLLPSSPLSPSSLQGSRISSVTIVKASPDSKREFSVITMVDKEDVTVDQKGESAEIPFKSEKGQMSSAIGKQQEILVGESEVHRRGTSGAETSSFLGQDKEDMMEMEDIRDCKVTQMDVGKESREEMLGNQSEQNQDGTSQDDEEFAASCSDSRGEKSRTTN